MAWTVLLYPMVAFLGACSAALRMRPCKVKPGVLNKTSIMYPFPHGLSATLHTQAAGAAVRAVPAGPSPCHSASMLHRKGVVMASFVGASLPVSSSTAIAFRMTTLPVTLPPNTGVRKTQTQLPSPSIRNWFLVSGKETRSTELVSFCNTIGYYRKGVWGVSRPPASSTSITCRLYVRL